MKNVLRISKRFLTVPAAAVLVMASAAQCQDPPVHKGDTLFGFSSELAYDEGLPANAAIDMFTSGSWNITITDTGTGKPAEWLRCDPESGKGSALSRIWIPEEYVPNPFGRSAEIRVQYDTKADYMFVSQKGFPQREVTPRWMELPVVNKDEGIFISHYCDVFDTNDNTNKNVRNYSMFFDPEMNTALWVAYPLHNVYFGSESTSNWSYNPLLPREWQTNWSATDLTGYKRGHQIANADRKANRDMNRQTYYFTNATPQNSTLNNGKWSSFENFLRGKVSLPSQDTVWVVTGALFHDMTATQKEEIEILSNKNNARIPKPNYYYKVALWHKTVSASEKKYTAVGFWVEHEPITGGVNVNDIYNVREIEGKSGFEFFPQLPEDVRDQVKSLTVQQIQADWGIN